MSAALLAAVLLAAARPAAAQSLRAVLSADTRPYQEAWEGFHAELGAAADRRLADDPGAGDDARVVVAFGAKASLLDFGAGVRRVVAMSPAVDARGADDVKVVCMTPAPAELLARLRALQPGLKRLGVPWKSDFYGARYLPLLQEAAKAVGVDVVAFKTQKEADLPDLVRSLNGRMDALWLPPDPLLINERSFVLFRDFSLANAVPLYVPVPGLAERGAAASVGVGFRAIGREAARVARRLDRGEAVPALSFPGPVETIVNRESAAQVGLKVDAAALKALERTDP